MKSKEALKQLCEECHNNIIAQESKGWLPHKECPFRHISNDYCENYEIIKKDLELLNLYKKLFKYSLNEVFDAKYLIDPKRPDLAIRLTDDEYELLKGGEECKYVKTKNGIYERDKFRIALNCVEIRKGDLTSSSSSTFEYIIDQSDNLIDLCDKFILIGKDDEPNEIMDDVQVEYYVKDGYVPESEIYGAIWTDKELKNVCKLNKNGELELLKGK